MKGATAKNYQKTSYGYSRQTDMLYNENAQTGTGLTLETALPKD